MSGESAGAGSAPPRKKISFGLRWRVAAAQGFLCALCGETLGEEIDVDHILPVCSGGSDSMSNLQVLHLRCHRRKTRFENGARNRGTSAYTCEECDVVFSRH